MIELILVDLSRLDQLELDHVSDSTTIAQLKKTIGEKILALDECDRVKLFADQQTAHALAKVGILEEDIRKLKKELRKQKFIKWVAIVVGGAAVILSFR